MSDIMSHIFANDLTLYRFNCRKIFWFDQWLVSSATFKIAQKKPQKARTFAAFVSLLFPPSLTSIILQKSTLRSKAAESTNYHEIPTNNNMKQLMIMLFWCQCAIFEKDHAQQEHQTTELGFGSRGFRHASGTSYNFSQDKTETRAHNIITTPTAHFSTLVHMLYIFMSSVHTIYKCW